MKRLLLGLAGIGVVALMAGAGTEGEVESSAWRATWGGDLRIRQEIFDNIPIIADPPAVTRGGKNNYFRIRPRLWGSLAWEEFTLAGRLANEFRHYIDPDAPSPWDWPDEIVVDQLYFDAKGLLDGKLDLRLGRQDLIYGAGRLILEGTPKDGSRTIFMDAIKLSLHLDEHNSIDLLGIYNKPEARLEIGHYDRDNTGFDKYHNKMRESGGGLYARLLRNTSMPTELYFLVKDESRWDSFGGEPLAPVRNPGRRTQTLGARLLPRVNDHLSFEFEGAWQFGTTDDYRDISACMAYGGATVTLPFEVADGAAPKVTTALYYLSGDDPETEKEEGWNPLWARFIQFSELYIYAWDAEKAGYYSNLVYPHVAASLACDKFHQIKVTAGLLYADEKDGPGGGARRGNFFTARYDFPLGKGLLHREDRLVGHLVGELLDPGSYYNVNQNSWFARWELSYSF